MISALSLYWLCLVLPATFAEVIALGLKTSGINGYINVQVFAGAVYIASFVSSMSTPFSWCPGFPAFTGLTRGLVWLLRSWKVQQIERLDMAQGERNAAAVGGSYIQTKGFTRKYIAGIFAIKRV